MILLYVVPNKEQNIPLQAAVLLGSMYMVTFFMNNMKKKSTQLSHYCYGNISYPLTTHIPIIMRVVLLPKMATLWSKKRKA
jgi:hypothetical protein